MHGRSSRIVSVLLSCLLMASILAATATAAPETMEIASVLHVVGGSEVYIPKILGMKDAAHQEELNKTLFNAIFAFANPGPGSSLNGSFIVTFFNQELLIVHFRGNSYTPGTAHPNKIDQGVHLDLVSGKLYGLEDLFKSGVDIDNLIKRLCAANDTAWRLNLAGLWDKWTIDTFARSWSGTERSFLLAPDSMRVYSVPSFATGPISGYKVPFAALQPHIDTTGDFWRRLQGSLPVLIKAQNPE